MIFLKKFRAVPQEIQYVASRRSNKKMRGRKRCQPFPNIKRYTFSWELPGDLVARLQSLVGELRSYKPHDMAKGKRIHRHTDTQTHTQTHTHTHTHLQSCPQNSAKKGFKTGILHRNNRV